MSGDTIVPMMPYFTTPYLSHGICPAQYPQLLMYTAFFPTPAAVRTSWTQSANVQSPEPFWGPTAGPCRSHRRPYPRSPCVYTTRESKTRGTRSGVIHSPRRPFQNPGTGRSSDTPSTSRTTSSFVHTHTHPMPVCRFLPNSFASNTPFPQTPLRIPRPTSRSVGTFSPPV